MDDGRRIPANTLGVVGGMGPAATNYFLSRVTALTPADRDQDHLPVLVLSDPTIPDRNESFQARDNRARDQIVTAVSYLSNTGCALIAVPCNSAHIWFQEMQHASAVPVLNIVDEATNSIAKELSGGAHVGIMATNATITTGLYQDRLRQRGFQVVGEEDPRIQENVNQGIRLLKAGKTDQAAEKLGEATRALIDRGAEGLVVGCTDISPIADKLRRDLPIPIVDSTESLARVAVSQLNRTAKGSSDNGI